MNSVEDIKINSGNGKLSVNTTLEEAEFIGTDATIAKPIQSSGQHISTESLHLEHLSESANENNFSSLLGRFQFRHEPDLPRSNAVVDLVLTMVCFAAVHIAYLGSLDLSTHRSVGLFSSLCLVSLIFYVGGMYNNKRLRRLNVELTNLIVCWMFAFSAIGLFAFLSKTGADISRVWITLSMLMSLGALASIRILGSLGFMARNKTNGRNIALLGNDLGVKSLLTDLGKLSNSQLKLAKVFNTPAYPSNPIEYENSLIDKAKQLSHYIENQRQCGTAIEQVWIVASENQAQVVKVVSEMLINSSVDVCVVPDQYTQRLLKGDITRFGDTDVVNVSEVSLSLAADQFKRVFDVFIASIGLMFIGLPMLIIAGLIKLESKGPALFRQKRYGVDGREIEILKFRSMYLHSDKDVQQAVKNDTRVTRVGRIIRKTSLDELPQLLNVLNGTMSLVGPRPHAVAHNELWRQEIQGYMLRHKVRPGITGWAQVNGWRGETDTAYKMQQRVKYDLEYIRNWSPWLDLKIMVLTVFVGFLHKNAY